VEKAFDFPILVYNRLPRRGNAMSAKTRATVEDLYKPDVIECYKVSDPEKPVIFRRGDMADAEPAVPRWWMAVEGLFG
jgi:hypothetical protein